jgi:hypothetical protein
MVPIIRLPPKWHQLLLDSHLDVLLAAKAHLSSDLELRRGEEALLARAQANFLCDITGEAGVKLHELRDPAHQWLGSAHVAPLRQPTQPNQPVQMTATSSSSTPGAAADQVSGGRWSEKGRRMRAILEPPVLVDCSMLGPLLHKSIALLETFLVSGRVTGHPFCRKKYTTGSALC